MTRLVTLIALVTALGCASDAPPTAPSPAPGANSGTWVGTTSDSLNGAGTLRLELTELTVDVSRSLLGGTWRAEYPDGGATGTVAGLRNGAAIDVVLEPSTLRPCPPALFPSRAGAYSVTLTVGAGTMAGAYNYQSCDGVVPGTLSLERR